MNILLTDLNSLPLDLPQRPVTADGSDSSFNHLFRDQLPVAAARDSQVVDLNSFFSEVEVTAEMPPRTVAALPAEFMTQFSHQQPGLAAAVATSPAPPVEVAAQASFEVLLPQIEPAAGSADEGASLPPGGNPLPVADAGPATGQAGAPVPAVPGQAAVGLQTAVSAAASTPPTGASIAVDADARGRYAGQAPAVPETSSSPSPGSASVSAAVSPRAASQSTPALAARPDAGADDSPATAPRAAQPPAAPSRPADAASAAASTARDDAEIRPAPVPGAMPELKRPETAAIKVPAAPRGAVAVDNARSLHSRTPAEFVMPAARLVPETGTAGGEAAARSVEMPLPVNNAAQAQASATPPLPQPAMPPVQAAAPAQSTVPTESLGLARGADATDWGNAVGERVSWMINHKQNSASIRLDPPVLGKLDVQVRVSDDATTITIQAQHAQTRDLIDAASLRLRDYLQDSGFQNVNVDVSQRHDQQQARAQSSSPENGGEQADTAAEQDSEALRQGTADYSHGEGLLDTFA